MNVSPIELGKSFIYLGKQFNHGMKIDDIKEELKNDNVKYVTTIDRLPLNALNKTSIIQKYVYSKYRWLFTIYDLSETWVVENIDNVIGKYLRKWLQLPVSANISHLSFTTRKLGINITFAKEVYQKCKLSLRRILRLSKNREIRRLYSVTSANHIRSDSIINNVVSKNGELNLKQVASKSDQLYNKREIDEKWNNLMKSNEQNIIIDHILSVCCSKVIAMWQSLIQRLPDNIFSFVRKALIFSLPNKSNLFRWKLVDSSSCSMCNQGAETQLHIFSNCCKYLDRYLWRHNSVLHTIVNKLSRATCDNVKVYADLPDSNYSCTSDLFMDQRPDIAIKLNGDLIIIELTVCFDTNTHKSRSYKEDRYYKLKENLRNPCNSFEILYVEITTLGFISTVSYRPFCKLLKKLGINDDRTISKCMETAIRGTYFVFCRRNKQWEVTDLLNFY